MRLEGKRAIVTGAGSGIGKGIAEVFAEEAAAVACVDRDLASAEATAEMICRGGRRAIAVECDIAREDQVERMVQQTLEAFGRIDVLVNNAGVNFCKAFDELTGDDWDRVVGVDLRGTFLCIRACIGHFLAQESGSVVNIATVHTAACLPGAAPYDAAKWGMVGLTKSLAVEYAARNIRFNCLSPGLIGTQIWQDIQEAAENREECLTHWRANIPMGRVGTVGEIARAAVFLASDDASYITGANLVADGGMTSLLVSKESYRSRSLEGQ